MYRTRIKICGITDPLAALCAAESGADAIGFVFHKDSPRSIEPRAALDIAAMLPPFVSTVGLFVDPELETIAVARDECPFDFLQLHGNESPDFVRQCGGWVIKAIRFDADTIADEFLRWNEVTEVGALLIDGSSGGEGRSFDWADLAKHAEHSEHPLVLAGGLTPDNVGKAVRMVQPWCVDVSSGVELERGKKDLKLIEQFCAAVRDADLALS